ncbi:MAG: hypothetical protein IJM19_08410, partial [Ruminococcus sp.]|nr:hypothetical protein [Ruminococcus sp.]
MKIQVKSFTAVNNSKNEFISLDEKTRENIKIKISYNLSEILSEIFSSDRDICKLFSERT